ncbi:MAG: tetratricopeptide repeat protein [Gammaproteobacteria bacterium]|jgi:tetratricopeptide (TPR) repeat protein
MRRQLPLLAVWFVLGGCSSVIGLHDYNNQHTVGSLYQTDLPPVQASEPKHNRAIAIRHYEAFLKESPDSKFVPEAIRRLADLNLEIEQEALAEGRQPTDKSRAAELYAELLQRFPDFPDNDSALYQLARAREQSGDVEPAMEALTSYARTYRDGDKYDEAQFRRGEHLFVRRDYRQAEQAYQAVLDQGDDSAFHQHALYKLGWARFKQNHYAAALDAYMQLLDESIGEHDSAELPAAMSRADQERIDDTLRAVSLSFSYLGGHTAVRDYYDRRGARSYEPLVYARLAALHLSTERFTDAAETYSLFAQVHPQHREAPLFQSRVIDVYKQAGFSERVLEEKQSFVERYEPAAAYWQGHDPAQSPEVLAQVQRHLRDIARHFHAVAQHQGKPQDYDEAARWYRLYLRSFPESEQAPYMNFLYAELLTAAGRHGLAAAQYERTAYGYAPHDKAAEAGYAALLAYDKHEPTLKGAEKRDWHRAGIASALRFSEQFPDHEQALPVRTRAAQQLYALHDYAQAIAAARPITDNSAAPRELQLSAWTVVAHAEFDLADYQRAELAYREVLARLPAASEQRARLEDRLAASIYKQGEQEKAAGNLAGAAEHFLRIAQAAPDSGINATARYDAAAAYIALQRWPDAIRILEHWRRDNPEHRLQLDVSRKLAVLYRENGQPLQAAGEFTRLSETDSDPQLRREAALTAASLYQQVGRIEQAIAAYEQFVERYPHPVEAAMEARQQLVLLDDQGGHSKRARYWREQLIAADRGAGAERSERTRYLAAHAQLALVADDYQAYRRVPLKEPLQQNLARKKTHMQAAIQGYRNAAAYEVAEVTTESAFHIGEIYADFAQALMTSERPANLNAEELEQYDILLEEQAYPFEEKAIAVHETNVRRIGAGVYDAWVRRSMDRLAQLLPVRYAKTEQGENYVAELQ